MDEETMTPFIAWGAGIKHKHQDIRSVALFLRTTLELDLFLEIMIPSLFKKDI